MFTGFANINLWYPWPFNFRTSHYWVAWITIGALVVHVGAKFSTTRRAITTGGDRGDEPAVTVERSTMDRRLFLGLVAGASGMLDAVHRRPDGVAAAQARAVWRPAGPTPDRRDSR